MSKEWKTKKGQGLQQARYELSFVEASVYERLDRDWNTVISGAGVSHAIYDAISE
jgi:hypothetical protein